MPRARAAHGRGARRRGPLGVRPEKIDLVPAAGGVARGAQRAARRRSPSRASSASRSSTSSRAPGGEELTVVAPNRDGAQPDALGAGQRGPADLGPAAHLRRRPGCLSATPTSSARWSAALRRRHGGITAAASSAAAAPPALGADRAGLRAGAAARSRARRPQRRQRQEAGHGQPPEGADRRHGLPNWPLYIDKKSLKAFDSSTASRSSTSRRSTTTTSSSARSASSSPGQDIGRDIVTLTDYMAARWIRDGYVAPSTRRTSRTSRTSTPTSRRSATTRSATTRCRGSRAARASATTRRRPGASWSASTTSSTRSSRAASRSCPSPTTPPASCCSAGQRPVEGRRSTTSSRRSTRSSKAKNAGQIRRFTGNDYTTDLTKGNVWVCDGLLGRPRPAQGRQPRPRVPLPRGGRDALHRQHDDAREPSRIPTRPRR